MTGLDFRRAANLFMASEEELARALGITADEVRRYRGDPASAPAALLARMGRVLLERGQGMGRVGAMLLEDYGE